MCFLGGNEAEPCQFKWVVSIQLSSQHTCGGVLISDRLVLTAAHCLFASASSYENPRINISLLTVLLGTHDLRINEEPFAYRSTVRKTTPHPLYRHYTNSNPNRNYDIGTIELTQPVTSLLGPNSSIEIIRLPSKDLTMAELIRNKVVVAGWGHIKSQREIQSIHDRTTPPGLRYAELQVIGNRDCQDRYDKRSFNVTSHVFCTSVNTPVCQVSIGCKSGSGGPKRSHAQ